MLPQLLKEQANRLNPAMKIRDMKLLVRSMQIVIRKPKTQHHRRNLQHILEIGHNWNRPAGAYKHRLFLERVVQCFGRRLDEAVIGADHASWTLAIGLDLDIDSLGRELLD